MSKSANGTIARATLFLSIKKKPPGPLVSVRGFSLCVGRAKFRLTTALSAAKNSSRVYFVLKPGTNSEILWKVFVVPLVTFLLYCNAVIALVPCSHDTSSSEKSSPCDDHSYGKKLM